MAPLDIKNSPILHRFLIDPYWLSATPLSLDIVILCY